MPSQYTSHRPISPPSRALYNLNDHLDATSYQQGSDIHGATALNVATNSYAPQHLQDNVITPSNTSEPSYTSPQQRPSASSEYLDTLQLPQHSAEGASPAFSFDDYLTPEFSAGEADGEPSNHTTPSVHEVWQQENHKNTYSLSQEADDFLISNAFNDIDQNRSLNVKVHPTAILTPELTVGALTPERAAHFDRNPLISSHMDQADFRQPRDTTSAPRTLDRSSMLSASRKSPSPMRRGDFDGAERSIAHAVSPVVMISTYNRGDSPARSHIPLSRTGSKRSQSSRLGEQSESVNDARDTEQRSSRLMPPEQWDDGPDDEDDTHDDDKRAAHQRSGVAPTHRSDGWIPSLNDMDKQKDLDSTRQEVEHWLANSEAGTPTGLEPRITRKDRHGKNRIRSRSTGTPFDANGIPLYGSNPPPGPGVLLEVASEDELSTDSDEEEEEEVESQPESPAANVDTSAPTEGDSYFPPVDDEEDIAPDQLEPLPRQFYRRRPWQDPVVGQEPSSEPSQPGTSNAAMYQWEKAAMRFETASRAATWGTRRRLSDSDINSILDGSQINRRLSLKTTLANAARARKSSLINSAKNMMPRRSSSFIKKHNKASSRQASPDNEIERVQSPENHESRHSISSPVGGRRRSSFTKHSAPKSPPLNTGSALLAMTSQLTAVGGSSVTVAPDAEPGKSPLLGALKRMRSRSDVSKLPKASGGGLPDLFRRHGGPPVPTLASPMHIKESPPVASAPAPELDDDMDNDAAEDEKPVPMELPIQAMNIIPNLEGFKTHARQLNPRLEPYLIDRIAHDQLKRYKKLVKNKVDHTKLVQQKQQCPSGSHCRDLGGKATILPPRTSTKDSGNNYAQFKVASGGDSDNEDGGAGGFVEGVVTPALFPPGIPLPPTTHLPAEFECFLCFQVKKFQKPSDWTKHVHEDVQPFSCTFPNCSEPKSFKRKADWVRHENERHRHLEWWKCSVQECAHVCYRKDNFVQHLVREHKMVEPKAKGQKSGTRARPTSRNTGLGHDQDDFWHLVESCRHENEAQARSEPCKFCSNVCNSWKKLSVHVGKHMEQIAMPTLQLARMQKVSPETVISPVEPPPARAYINPALDVQTLGAPEHFPRSPYNTDAHSYQASSAGQSPALMHVQAQNIATTMGQSYYNATLASTAMQPMTTTDGQFSNNHVMGPSYPYDTFNGMAESNYMPSQQPGSYSQAPGGPSMHSQYSQHQIPRSQAMETTFDPAGMASMQGAGFDQPHYYSNDGGDSSYMPGYGPDIARGHDGMIPGSHSGHASHGHTPGSTGHAETGMQYHPGQRPGPSAQGYHPYSY